MVSEGCAQLSTVDAPLVDFRGFEDFGQFNDAMDELVGARDFDARLSERLLREPEAPVVLAHCAVCQSDARFAVASKESYAAFQAAPNWRETLVCEQCQLINRLRAAIQVFVERFQPGRKDRIYLTERVTPLFEWVSQRYPGTEGSEYFGDDVEPGSLQPLAHFQVRHEDVTKLTFADAIFDHVLSFDVLEHVPDYAAALKEMFRVLAPGGRLMLSVPFNLGLEQTLVRARFGEDGTIEHLEEPEYHGDPVDSEGGVLCFYHFGWNLLQQLRDVGFEQAELLFYWNPGQAYLGWGQSLIIAAKPQAKRKG
jgi:SAM-dependent methyltransferase